MPHPLLLSLGALTIAAGAVGQSGRTMRLHAPAVIGQTARFAIQHPGAAAGNLYPLVWSPPFANAVPLAVPGLTVNGLVRVDLANAISAKWGVLSNSGMAPDTLVPIPNDPLLVGYAWDLQGVDLSPANVLTLVDDDLPIVVSAPPLPAANLVQIAPGTFPMGSPVWPLSHATPSLSRAHGRRFRGHRGPVVWGGCRGSSLAPSRGHRGPRDGHLTFRQIPRSLGCGFVAGAEPGARRSRACPSGVLGHGAARPATS